MKTTTYSVGLLALAALGVAKVDHIARTASPAEAMYISNAARIETLEDNAYLQIHHGHFEAAQVALDEARELCPERGTNAGDHCHDKIDSVSEYIESQKNK